jgi:hypothetical protein
MQAVPSGFELAAISWQEGVCAGVRATPNRNLWCEWAKQSSKKPPDKGRERNSGGVALEARTLHAHA